TTIHRHQTTATAFVLSHVQHLLPDQRRRGGSGDSPLEVAEGGFEECWTFLLLHRRALARDLFSRGRSGSSRTISRFFSWQRLRSSAKYGLSSSIRNRAPTRNV